MQSTKMENSNEATEQRKAQEAIICELTKRFPFGLPKDLVIIMLPSELQMALATINTWGPKSFPGVCITRTPVSPAGRLLDPSKPKYLGYLFSEDKGWYVVTPENLPTLEES